ncbi:hypothetical protein GCM10007079_22540 [Nocardiopsis terrae]|nr:hypothetical protein GCM10007079_22540 [Nocardiopsis terrae]
MPTATLAIMTIAPITANSGRLPSVMVISREPDPVMIGIMIIAEEPAAGGFSGSCGGVAITSGDRPGSGTVWRAGR